jgi:hypothetical protein
MKIIARSARQFFWRRARLRRHRLNCLSLRISSRSSIASMPHDRLPNLRDSLSDRALRPRPEAAVLLISLLRRVPFLAPNNSAKQRGAFSWVKRSALCCDIRAAVCPGVPEHINLVDYDVARSLLPPSSRGHAGRYSATGASYRFAACKRSRSAVAPSAVGPDAIYACADAITANKRWWNKIASN